MAVLERERPYRLRQDRPLPLDVCLQAGVGIWYDLQPRDVLDVLKRVDTVFDRMKADKTRQFGACITYAVGLQPHEIDTVDEILLESLNGRLPSELIFDKEIAGQERNSWRGEFEDTRFFLHKFTGSLALANNDIVPANVYSMVGSKA